MNPVRRLCLLLLASLLTACASAPSEKAHTAPLPAAVHAAIAAANEQLMTRFNRGDKVGVAAMYEDDAVMISGNERHEGRAAIDKYWLGSGERQSPPPTWTLEVLNLEGIPEMPIQRGRSVIRSTWQGEPHVSDVQFIVMWRRQPDNSYRIAVDAWWPTRK